MEAIAQPEKPQNAESSSADTLVSIKKVEVMAHDQTVTTGSIEDVLTETRPDIKWNITFGKIVWAVLVFLAALFVLKYLIGFLETFAERWTNLRLLIKRLIPIIRVAGWSFVVYVIIADIFAPPIQTLIAVTASAGIAIGFASQDILKNVFGGIMIILDRPFQVGDKIQVGQHYGEVVQIGLRSVRIVTPDDSLVSIPNSDLVNQSVSNSNSGQFYCQVVAEFYIPPNIDLVKLKRIAYRSAAVSRYVYLNKPIAIIIKNEIFEGRSLLKVRLKAYVLDLRYEMPFGSEMTETVMSELLKQNLISAADLAFTKETYRQKAQ
ncbi:MAG: mechanosensitive ion channel [Candidatus Latescibacteria bacterium]|nr:mechanosensitive ion channel [Candidatus Latescibacterota bacterium]